MFGDKGFLVICPRRATANAEKGSLSQHYWGPVRTIANALVADLSILVNVKSKLGLGEATRGNPVNATYFSLVSRWVFPMPPKAYNCTND